LPSKSELRYPSNQERRTPHPRNQGTEHKPLPVDALAEKDCDGIDEEQKIDQHQGIE
jgi:hypothetical protein